MKPSSESLRARSQLLVTSNNRHRAHDLSENRMAPTNVDALFYMVSSLIHTQFAYATVNHDKKPCSNNEQPNSQRKSSSGFTRDLRVKVTPCVQTRLLSWMA